MQTREKTLFFLLCGALFVALNMIGLNAFLKSRNSMKKELATVRAQLAEDRGWIELDNALKPADSWIGSHAMPKLPPEEASARLLKTERDEAEKAGLKIAEENLLPVQETPYGSTASVSVRLSGPFEGVVKMLFGLQGPALWRTLEKLSIKSDAQPPNVLADIEIRQYFQPVAPDSTNP